MKRLPYLLHAIALVVLVAIDQISKYFARLYLPGNPVTVIEGVFSFHYLENRGSVWGIMQGQQTLFILFFFLLFGVFVYLYIKMPKEKQYAPLLWILVILGAGAVGNTIDRIIFGYVTDFLRFTLIDFPTFNIADCYITVCSFLSIILVLTKYKDDEFEFLSFRRKDTSDADKKSDEI